MFWPNFNLTSHHLLYMWSFQWEVTPQTEHLVSCWCCLDREGHGTFRRCGLAGGSRSLGKTLMLHGPAPLRVSLSLSLSLPFLCLLEDLHLHLSALAVSAALPSCFTFLLHLPAMMESYPSGTMSHMNSSFYKLPWSWWFFTATEK